MEANGKNRFALQGVSLAQMMCVSKYKSHKIALFNSIEKSNIAPISQANSQVYARTLRSLDHCMHFQKKQKSLEVRGQFVQSNGTTVELADLHLHVH